MAEIYHTATEYVANELTIVRGDVDQIMSVGVYHTTDPNDIPDVADFVTVTLADGTTEPLPDLAEAGKIDVLSLIGPRDADLELTAGDYQRFVLITTATEDVIRKVDVITIL